MEGTIAINNCGECTKVLKAELCGLLLKSSKTFYKSYPRMFTTETDVLISKLQEATGIQIYKTGVVRIFFENGHFEERHTVYLRNISNKALEILKNI